MFANSISSTKLQKLSPFLHVSADSCEGLQIFGWFMEIIAQTRRNLTQKF